MHGTFFFSTKITIWITRAGLVIAPSHLCCNQGREMTSHHHESRPSCYVLSGGIVVWGLQGLKEPVFWNAALDLGSLPWPEQLCRPREHAVPGSPAAVVCGMEWISHAGRVWGSSKPPSCLVIHIQSRCFDRLTLYLHRLMFFKVKMIRISLSTPTQSCPTVEAGVATLDLWITGENPPSYVILALLLKY